jgi:hypothetical protein
MNAVVYATETIDLQAISSQTAPLVATFSELTSALGSAFEDMLDVNFVSVKVGNALIDTWAR